MWKKNEPQPTAPQPTRTTSPPPRSAGAPETATIGPEIAIKGDISGEGSLVIEGRVEGGIELKQHDVTIGRSGRVAADIRGKRICVEGEVKGDLFGDEVVIRGSGRVEGNATAAQVTLESGCYFRGSINMQRDGGTVIAGTPHPAKPHRLRRAAAGAA